MYQLNVTSYAEQKKKVGLVSQDGLVLIPMEQLLQAAKLTRPSVSISMELHWEQGRIYVFLGPLKSVS